MGVQPGVRRGPGEPVRVSPGGALSEKMSTLARKHTAPEIDLRRELWARGLRYRLHLVVPSRRRRTIDIAFPGLQLAVFVDGCFWHGCPQHGTRPRTNSEWWAWKIERNRERDADTTQALTADGWAVFRVWEHVPASVAADLVEVEVRRLRRRRAEVVAQEEQPAQPEPRPPVRRPRQSG
jgi:DNA mismatch endonuclease (patch repair protein)